MVSADELVGSAYVARRIWHSASRLSRVPSELPTPEGMHEMTLVLQVHGSVELRAAAGAIVLEPHDVALYATAEHPSLTSMQPTARIELMIRHLPAFGRRAPVLLPSHGPTAASTALSSMFNGVMNHEAPLMPTLTESMAKVVESHAELLILERHALATAGGGGPCQTSAERLYLDAMNLIEQSAHQPFVTTGWLAESLHVSRPYLARVFRQHGRQPGDELRRRRVHLARTLQATGHMEAAEIAQSSGFRSVRAMRETLRSPR